MRYSPLSASYTWYSSTNNQFSSRDQLYCCRVVEKARAAGEKFVHSSLTSKKWSIHA